MFWVRIIRMYEFLLSLFFSHWFLKSADKGQSNQSYSFSSTHVWMWELDYKESWALKNWCFWTVVLEKTLVSSLDCKEIQPVHTKGNQPWTSTRRLMLKWSSNTLATWCEELIHWKILGLDPGSKPFNITVIQTYTPTSNVEEVEVEWFYEDLQDLLELIPKTDVLFIIGDWNAKVEVKKHWGNRQIWPWSMEWSRAKANRVLPRECTGHSKHLLLKTQEKTLHMDITRWSRLKSNWLYSLQQKMEKLYTVIKNKTGSWLWLRSWTPHCQIQT